MWPLTAPTIGIAWVTGVRFPAEAGMFLFTTKFRPTLEPTQPERSWQSLRWREMPRFLWNPKVHYRVHKSPQLVPVLNQTQSTPCFQIRFNIIFSFTPRSPKCGMHFKLSNSNFLCISHLSHACYIPRPFYFPWLDRHNNIWWSVQVMKLLIM
jgi:hypothetical protein